MLDYSKSNEELFLEKLKCESFEGVVDYFYSYVEVKVKLWRGKLEQTKASIGEVAFQDYLNQERQKLVSELRTLKASDFELQYDERVLTYYEIWLSEIKNILPSLTWDWSAEQVQHLIRVNMNYKIVYDCLTHLKDPFFEQLPPQQQRIRHPASTGANEKKKEINITPENVELIYTALASYFTGEEAFKQLLEGKAIQGKVEFDGSAKELCNTFNTLHEAGRINATVLQIKDWLCNYFQVNHKPYDLKKNSTLNRYFEEKIERHGQILVPTIKHLITFDKL